MGGSKQIPESACLVVGGVSADATLREVHVLFSGCPGYLSSSIVREATEKLYALVKFEEKTFALQAAESRRGTVWEHGASPVDLDFAEHEQIEQAALPEVETDIKPRPSRTSPGETSPSRSKSAAHTFLEFESETLTESSSIGTRKSMPTRADSASASEHCLDETEKTVNVVQISSTQSENAGLLQPSDREAVPQPRQSTLDIIADRLKSSSEGNESPTEVNASVASGADMDSSPAAEAVPPGGDISVQDGTDNTLHNLQTSPALNHSAEVAGSSVQGEAGQQQQRGRVSKTATKTKGRASSLPCERRTATPTGRSPSKPRAKSPASMSHVPDKSVLEDWQERLRKEKLFKKQDAPQKIAFGDLVEFEKGPNRTESQKFTVAAETARVRLKYALEKRILVDIEAALHDAEVAGVGQHETARAKVILNQTKHRLNVRTASFAQTRATNRISDAWKILQTADVAPNRRIAAVHVALREGREAASLCAKAEMKKDEARIQDALDFLSESWSAQAQERLQDATKRRDQTALVMAIAEAEAIKTSLQWPSVEAEPTGQQVSVMDDLAQSSAGAIVSEGDNTSVPDTKVSPRSDDGAVFLQGGLEKSSLTRARWQLDDASWDFMLRKGQETLANEERGKLVLMKIEDALNPESKTFAKRSLTLEHLIQEGKDYGVDPLFLARAEMAASIFKGRATARWGLFGAAIAFQQDGTLLTILTAPARMRSAIKQAKNAGLVRRELQCAFDLYERMETVHAMQQGLAEALRSGDHEYMCEKLEEAKKADIWRQDSEIFFLYMKCIEQRLAIERRRLDLERKQVSLVSDLKRTLISGRQSVVLHNLPDEIERAKELQLEKPQIKAFEQVLQHAQSQQRAQQQLELAMVDGDVVALRNAIQVAKARDVNQQLLAAAETALAEEELLIDLNKAVQDEDLVALDDVILSWRHHSFDKTVLDEAEARRQQLLDAQSTRQVRKIQDQVSRYLEEEPIRFLKGKSQLSKDGVRGVEKLCQMLQGIPKALIRIDAHTSLGAQHTAKFVMKLSQHRAETVMKELKNMGCPNPVTAQGWGNTHPKVKNPCIRVIILDSGRQGAAKEGLHKRMTDTAASLSSNKKMQLTLPRQLALLLHRNHARLVDLLSILDANSEGQVTRLELANALKDLPVHASEDEVDELFELLDSDKSGGIDFRELQRALLDEAKREQHVY